jgi:hypothetical protein
MSGIDKVASSLKKKMSLADYKPQTQERHEVSTSTLYNQKTSLPRNNSRNVETHSKLEKQSHSEDQIENGLKSTPPVKTTVYIPASAKRGLDQIYANRILAGNKTDLSELLAEALELLIEKESARIRSH